MAEFTLGLWGGLSDAPESAAGQPETHGVETSAAGGPENVIHAHGLLTESQAHGALLAESQAQGALLVESLAQGDLLAESQAHGQVLLDAASGLGKLETGFVLMGPGAVTWVPVFGARTDRPNPSTAAIHADAPVSAAATAAPDQQAQSQLSMDAAPRHPETQQPLDLQRIRDEYVISPDSLSKLAASSGADSVASLPFAQGAKHGSFFASNEALNAVVNLAQKVNYKAWRRRWKPEAAGTAVRLRSIGDFGIGDGHFGRWNGARSTELVIGCMEEGALLPPIPHSVHIIPCRFVSVKVSGVA